MWTRTLRSRDRGMRRKMGVVDQSLGRGSLTDDMEIPSGARRENGHEVKGKKIHKPRGGKGVPALVGETLRDLPRQYCLASSR